MNSSIITLHDVAGNSVLVNLDQMETALQEDRYCTLFMSSGNSVKVQESVDNIGKIVNAPKRIY
jgi:uncharacterized protein YlzI (FlbEa/FlbD family)